MKRKLKIEILGMTQGRRDLYNSFSTLDNFRKWKLSHQLDAHISSSDVTDVLQ